MSAKAISIENSSANHKALNIGLWVVQVLVAAMFFKAGGNKLMGNPQMVGLFEAIGIGQWFRYLTGSFEVIGAVLVLIPALSGVGGLLLVGVMGGALATHLFILGGDPTMAIVLLIASVIVAFGRRDRTLRLLGR